MTDYAPTGFCMKLLKSRSFGLFQSGIIGSWGFIDIVSTIIVWSYALKLSNPYIGLLKSTGSSIIIESFIHAVLESADGSRAPVVMNVVGTIWGSCLTGETICDCLGNGLFIGGVGGALLRTKGLSKAKDLVVGVPLYDDEEEA